MAISRADLLKELLPGLNELFGMEYKTQEEIRIIQLTNQVVANEAKKKKELENECANNNKVSTDISS